MLHNLEMPSQRTAYKPMIPNSHALVPLHPHRQAALKAIGVVESKVERRIRTAKFPYATAFFKELGYSHIGVQQIRIIDYSYNPKLRLGSKKEDYISAINKLIETRGEVCWLPLTSSAGDSLFPEIRAGQFNRRDHKIELKVLREGRIKEKERNQKRRRYQTRLSQAGIELAFNTPTTLGRWYSKWANEDLYEHDLATLLYSWVSRFPSLADVDMYYLKHEPLWGAVYQITAVSGKLDNYGQYLDRAMLPNKLRLGN